MNDLERTINQAIDDGAEVIHYEAETDQEGAEVVTAVAVTRGDRTIMASVGWTAFGPYVDVYGFVGDDQVELTGQSMEGRISVGYASS